MPGLFEMTFHVEAAWTLPTPLATEAGDAMELFYVRMPFAADVEQRAGHDAHARLLEHVARALVSVMGVDGDAYGVRRWPADDFIAWRPAGGAELHEDTLRDAILEVATPLLASAAEAASLSVARVPLSFESEHREQAFARAVTAAARAASDPKGYQLECSASLLDRAIAERAFLFHHQPIVDCHEQTVIAYEWLCRGTMEGMKFPDLIFGVAERTNRVHSLGQVLRRVIADELSIGGATERLHFINVHPTDLDDPVFAQEALEGGLAQHASSIVFELTERAAIEDYPRVKSFFGSLRARGYRLAIDDLGSGYAGLTALAELDPDFIKFDMALVRDLHEHPVKRRLLQRMHQFATEIGAKTISEGVETKAERDALMEAGCAWMQGYFFARPAPGFVAVDEDRYPPALSTRQDAM
jgi:EAL domain-containing protein (putative c-di-GMP-specific phosphodiesterase class I)